METDFSEKVVNGRYKILELIGEGGFSRIYKCLDQKTRDQKVFRTLKNETISNQIEDIIRFRNEAFILSRLDHPNIVKVYETGEFEGRNYIILEYIDGESLDKLIKKRKIFSEAEILEIMIRVSSGLDHIHSHNMIHKDLKPGNI